MNKTIDIFADDYTIIFFLQTDGEPEFWYWIIDKADYINYFEARGMSVIYDNAHYDVFVNDMDNDTLGTSGGFFKDLETARKEVLNND